MAEKRPLDTDEINKVRNWHEKGCGCQLGPEGCHCSATFTVAEIEHQRDLIMELDRYGKDMMIMGFLLSSKPKNASFTTYTLHGQRVCKETFLFVPGLSKKYLANLTEHYLANGTSERKHGNKGRSPHNAFSLATKEHFKQFMLNFGEEHAVYLPGRIPGHRDTNILLLPSFNTKYLVYKVYVQACVADDIGHIGKSLFAHRQITFLPAVERVGAIHRCVQTHGRSMLGVSREKSICSPYA